VNTFFPKSPVKTIFFLFFFSATLSSSSFSTSPEALHAILLGHGTGLLNAFARLEKEKKEQKQKKKKDDEEEDEEEDIEDDDEEKPAEKKRKNFVFTGDSGKKFSLRC